MTSRFASIALLAALAAALWYYRAIAARYGLFGGTMAFGLDVAASAMTAVASVLLAAEVIAGLIVPYFTAARPTGFERAAAYLVFALAAFVVGLAHFGVHVAAVLTTSAVLTAIIGLALQPTLGAFVAGFALNADRVLRVGDGIVYNGETLAVVAIGWRSVVCARGDGTRTVMSNSRILDVVDIVPGDAPVRAELFLVACLSLEPQRIAAAIANAIAELPGIDHVSDIAIVPVSFDTDKAQARYRVHFWARSRRARDEVLEQVFLRLWYAFQREDIWPVTGDAAAGFDAKRPRLTSIEWTARLAGALDRAAADGAPVLGRDDSVQAAAKAGTLLLYGDGERIIVPERLAGCRLLVVRGALRDESEVVSARVGTTGQLARRGELARLAGHLAHAIGPYAEVAVKRAALDEPNLDRVRDTVAREIDDDAERRAFAPVPPPPSARLGVGRLLDCRRGADGLLQCDPPLRAEGEAAIVALPLALP